MNKAFVREPDDTGERNCPRCGSIGLAVPRDTVANQLPTGGEVKLSEPVYFCPLKSCDVAYFDSYERSLDKSELAKPIWPKDPTAPICSCFGLTADDIEADIAEGGVRRVKEIVAKAKSPAANCSVLAPSGRNCVSEVQRYYMHHRANGDRG